jgi:SH3-like domain-containing protein
MTRSIPGRQYVIFFFTALLLAVLPTQVARCEYLTVVKDGVNIRSGPSTRKEILWEVFKGFPLKVVEKKGGWSQVMDFEGDKGWIYSPLLSREKRVIVKSNTVNMRKGPGLNYDVVATVKYGVVLKPVGSEREWIKVIHSGGTTGWIHKPLIWPQDF